MRKFVRVTVPFVFSDQPLFPGLHQFLKSIRQVACPHWLSLPALCW